MRTGTTTHLRDAVPVGGTAYVVTVATDGRAHVAPVEPVVGADSIALHGVGARTSANVAAGGPVTVLWAPPDPGGYTLIVDGVGEMSGSTLAVRPGRAVLHRPRPGPRAEGAGHGCTADCVELAVE